MKYLLEYHPNPDCMEIHLDLRVTDEMIDAWDSPLDRGIFDKKQPDLVRDLFKIAGVSRVTFHSYSIGLLKGSAFDWPEIVRKALLAIQANLEPMGVMVEKCEPIHRPQPQATEGADLFDDTLF
jgi:hypothetical protein